MVLLSVAIVTLIITVKVFIDVNNWGNVNHGGGLFIVLIILGSYSWFMGSPLSLFLYATFFNPIIAVVRDEDFFYIGNTATIDKLINKYLGGGKVSFSLAALGTIASLIIWVSQ